MCPTLGQELESGEQGIELDRLVAMLGLVFELSETAMALPLVTLAIHAKVPGTAPDKLFQSGLPGGRLHHTPEQMHSLSGARARHIIAQADAVGDGSPFRLGAADFIYLVDLVPSIPTPAAPRTVSRVITTVVIQWFCHAIRV
jgi:hypothetical protein